ncbi:hypothetical protein ACFFWD_23105 [Bradyrhizobium erythrophlei]|uniref:hypothetical protein n=1 Tax=Bradyrhizobium erythrophlei TaxID=1437360 RepID=UPI0035EB94AC
MQSTRCKNIIMYFVRNLASARGQAHLAQTRAGIFSRPVDRPRHCSAGRRHGLDFSITAPVSRTPRPIQMPIAIFRAGTLDLDSIDFKLFDITAIRVLRGTDGVRAWDAQGH